MISGFKQKFIALLFIRENVLISLITEWLNKLWCVDKTQHYVVIKHDILKIIFNEMVKYLRCNVKWEKDQNNALVVYSQLF